MDFSPMLNPTVIFGAIGGIVGFIVWLVRLEGKIATEAAKTARLEKEVEKLNAELETHRANQDIHFNIKISTRVEQENERRFQMIEKQLGEINQKLDRMADKK